MSQKRIYLDYAAATPTDKSVLKNALPLFNKFYGNPSSIHKDGVSASIYLENSRKIVSKILSARPSEVIFTNGGTESDNLALLGVAKAARGWLDKNGFKGHIITSAIEHHAVLRACQELESTGFDVTYIKPQQNGVIDPSDIKTSLRDDTILVSIMYANNEIGTIQPIYEIAKTIRWFRGRSDVARSYPYFHTDACQATNYLPLNVNQLGVDLLTLSGSKIYSFKGTGLLFVKTGVNISPIMFGGHQELNLRPGTENLPYIVGFAKAMEISEKIKEKESTRLTTLRDYFLQSLNDRLSGYHLNGDDKVRLPNNINVSFDGIEGEQLVLELDAAGVSVSAGSACTSNDTGASHVLIALGLDYDRALGAVRFSFGRHTVKKDIDYVMRVLPVIIDRIRKVNLR